MNEKRAFFAAVAVVWFFIAGSTLLAADAAGIDKIRSKPMLDDADLLAVDKFVAQSIDELIKGTDFTMVSKIRAGVVSRASATSESSAAQYAQQFIESVHKHMVTGFAEAANLSPEDIKFRATLNLLILAEELGSIQLTDLALKQLDSKNKAVCYWAVRCVTNPAIIKQLKQSDSPENSKLAEQVIDGLKGIIAAAGPDTIACAADFADKMETPQADALLLQIADMRIKKYADWIVQDEQADLAVLGALSDKLSLERGNQEFGRRFGQLYSYAIQRYIANAKGGNFLPQAEKDQLTTVLVETEKSYLGKFLGIQQTTIKKAVETNDQTSLWQEHNRLLGDESKTGELPAKLKFDYGDKRISPLVLPPQPK